ncbi:single-stranded DNA-binding protein [Gracilibacillus alcaliphilus]|uniref:single-stranded DNA-binding protein n=1 Tax=Gracilibacillus alcaliphilus TaxID=1401441 RepID=UPI001959D248|nr:single-stranded DNA-binding protein [Gracilibacillus alcaliphilus]MBM7678945.1 single-strand DNA-binding protein [Gracilibacillus alcaliphilus]
MINRVVLVGRLTKDPELRYTPNGVAVCNFTLAVNRPFKDQNGESQADFIQVQTWRKIAENTANYLGKGSLAGIDGRIQTRNYEGDDGKRVYITEVVADSVQFLDTRNGQNQPQSNDSGASNMNTPQTNNNENSGGYEPNQYSGPIDISDDDLPF